MRAEMYAKRLASQHAWATVQALAQGIMRQDTPEAIWARDGIVVTGWLSLPNSFSAEVMAHQEFDSLTVAMQHGVCWVRREPFEPLPMTAAMS
jgi:2-keto-3-deoxy-L-rhamnonate aldolase RhmA